MVLRFTTTGSLLSPLIGWTGRLSLGWIQPAYYGGCECWICGSGESHLLCFSSGLLISSLSSDWAEVRGQDQSFTGDFFFLFKRKDDLWEACRTKTHHVFWVTSFQMRFGAKILHRYFPTFFKTSPFKTLFCCFVFLKKCHQGSVFSEKMQAFWPAILKDLFWGSYSCKTTPTKGQLKLKNDNCFHSCPQPSVRSQCDCGDHKTPSSSPSTQLHGNQLFYSTDSEVHFPQTKNTRISLWSFSVPQLRICLVENI